MARASCRISSGTAPQAQYSPVRDGSFDGQLASGDTAFARVANGHWSEQRGTRPIRRAMFYVDYVDIH